MPESEVVSQVKQSIYNGVIMGSKAELFYKARQIRTNVPTMCIVCYKDRILNWSEEYCQWICDKCMGEVPRKGKLKFKNFYHKLYQRKLKLRSENRWTSSSEKSTE